MSRFSGSKEDLLTTAGDRGCPAPPLHSSQGPQLEGVRAVEWLDFQKLLFGTMQNKMKSVCYQLWQFQTNWPRKGEGFPLSGTVHYSEHRRKGPPSSVHKDKVKQPCLENHVTQSTRD